MPRPGTRQQRGYTEQYLRVRSRLIQRQPWCFACGSTHDLTADHIVPLARGGTNALSNLRVLCRSCNSSRGRGGVLTQEQASEPSASNPRNKLVQRVQPRRRFSRNKLTG